MKKIVSIPKPCSENWQEMTQSEQGRFCAKCSKVVTDFTEKSVDEILRFIEKQKGEVCGRVRTEQIHIGPTLSEKLKRFLYALAMVFLPFLGFAQQADSTNDPSLIDSTAVKFRQTTTKKVVVAPEYGIRGKVRTQKEAGIAATIITIRKEGELIAKNQTDSNGQYVFTNLPTGFYEIEYSANGFVSVILLEAEVKKGFVWDISPVLDKRKKKNKATHETRIAAKNPGGSSGVIMMGGFAAGGMRVRTEIHPLWKGPGEPIELLLRNLGGR